jgi:peptidoglycan hydrolase-like protein with peptidoglycan-binding domain
MTGTDNIRNNAAGTFQGHYTAAPTMDDVAFGRYALELGERGDLVTQIQNQLIALGYDVGDKGADGFLGPNTQAAIQEYQRRNNLEQNGVFADNTYQSMFAGDASPVFGPKYLNESQFQNAHAMFGAEQDAIKRAVQQDPGLQNLDPELRAQLATTMANEWSKNLHPNLIAPSGAAQANASTTTAARHFGNPAVNGRTNGTVTPSACTITPNAGKTTTKVGNDPAAATNTTSTETEAHLATDQNGKKYDPSGIQSGVHFFKPTNESQFGHSKGVVVRDYEGNAALTNADSYGAALGGRVAIAEIAGKAGDAHNGTGIEGRAGVDVRGYLGGYGAVEHSKDGSVTGVQGRAGAYVGAVESVQGQVGLGGWISAGAEVGKAQGLGADVGGGASWKDGKISINAHALGAIGLGGKLGGNLTINYGKAWSDIKSWWNSGSGGNDVR